MIQFNLLPDSKLERMKSRRIQRLIIFICLIASIVAIVISGLLFVEVKVHQKHQIAGNNQNINTGISKLDSVTNLSQVLKINDAIKVLPSLYNSRPVVTRLPGFLSLLTPANVTISDIAIDFSGNTMTISGSANTTTTINTFVDTLEFAEFTNDGGKTKTLAFSNVLLSSFSYASNSSTGEGYGITLSFNPAIFSATDQNLELVIPNQITTRSDLDQPQSLFQQQPTNNQGTSQ